MTCRVGLFHIYFYLCA